MVRILVKVGDTNRRLIHSDYITTRETENKLHVAAYPETSNLNPEYIIETPDKTSADALLSELMSKGCADATAYKTTIKG